MRKQLQLTEELQIKHHNFAVKHNEDMQGHKKKLSQTQTEHAADLEELRKRLSSECESKLLNETNIEPPTMALPPNRF